ncbi:HAUS augmin-like complex subunit 8 isoform X3 [Microtus pennsylvanicus]|uniref:HAUS augmin-like complex subunit 8 isoform X3 n=1 Tax=Microtus pennsylvanicus TaxID=10058 RepID=UPI003F6C556F
MADSSERDAGKPAATGVPKTKGRRVQGGRVVESRYLQYEKKTKKASVSAGGKSPEGRKPSTLQKVKGPHVPLTGPKGTTHLPQKRQDLQETMDMMESQTLLLTLLSVKMENNLAVLEEKAEKDLVALCHEKERLQQRVLELRRQLLFQQKHQELATILDAQMEVLGPLEAVAKRFKEQYKTLATALDATRHELPVQGIHMQGSGQELLDDLMPALKTTLQLLGELGISSPDASGQVPDTSAQVSHLLEELRDLITKKDQELCWRWNPTQLLSQDLQSGHGAFFPGQQGGSLDEPGSLGRGPGHPFVQPVVLRSRGRRHHQCPHSW